MTKTTLILRNRFVIWMCIVFLVDVIIDPSCTGSTKNFSVDIIPKRWWIKAAACYPDHSFEYFDGPEKRCCTFWTKLLNKWSSGLGFKLIFIEITGCFLNIYIFEIDWNTKSRTCSGLTISTVADAYSFGFSGRLVAHRTATTAALMYFACVQESSPMSTYVKD